jgi:hypothetical protein
MEKQRAILPPHTLDYMPCPGEREIRMRPLPLLYQSRPKEGGMPHV